MKPKARSKVKHKKHILPEDRILDVEAKLISEGLKRDRKRKPNHYIT
ncbi:MAG: hypothetical protein OEX77_05845 [Candidatus Bathyarchaeota archaeon]|nr:hypothetical protein [Candidatus Bathyarchaeota archaeon]MDH5733982.1 hypothetical protein [Candidatus Bathyarchaeota archaeon]